MTVLVTGGAGYIGSHMVHALLEADNLTTGFDWAVPPGATLIVGDAGDQSRVGALIAAHRIDAIIHFAASIVVPDSVRDPLGYYRNNTVNSRAPVRYFIFSWSRDPGWIASQDRWSKTYGNSCKVVTPRAIGFVWSTIPHRGRRRRYL